MEAYSLNYSRLEIEKHRQYMYYPTQSSVYYFNPAAERERETKVTLHPSIQAPPSPAPPQGNVSYYHHQPQQPDYVYQKPVVSIIEQDDDAPPRVVKPPPTRRGKSNSRGNDGVIDCYEAARMYGGVVFADFPQAKNIRSRPSWGYP